MVQDSNRWLVLAVLFMVSTTGCGEATGASVSDQVDTVSTEDADAQADAPNDAEVSTDDESSATNSGAETETDTDPETAQTDSDTGTSDMGTQTDEDVETSDPETQSDAGDDATDSGLQSDDPSADDSQDSDTGDGDTDEAQDTDTEDTSGYDLNGKWEGSYTCSQGFTRVTLQITHDSETHQLDTVFAFFADDSNPDVPTGRFTMNGTYDPVSHAVDLNEDSWIEQPGGYIMISLSGTLDPEANMISGTVLEPGCSTFTVARGG